MRSRILFAIVALTTLAVAVFGVALALSLRRQYRQEAVLRLEREATRAAVDVRADSAGRAGTVELPRPAQGTELGLYAADGHLASGLGPPVSDAAVRSALLGRVSQTGEADGPVIAVPVFGAEGVTGALRAGRPESDIEGRVHRAWLAMLGLGGGAILLSAVIASGVSRRISRPVSALAGAATRLGQGDFSVRVGRSDVKELDALGHALDATAERLGQLVQRERAFSADASHQLRTPIAALRLRLESAQMDPRANLERVNHEALGDLDRLERTVGDLLALARDKPLDRDQLAIPALFEEIGASYHGLLAARGRPLRVDLRPPLAQVRASTAAVRQVLHVLLGNALDHGAGAVTLRCRTAPGGMAMEVEDEGDGVVAEPESIFRRRSGGEAGRGIGLALARSLAEAEGGRLHLVRAAPHPLFALVLPTADTDA